MARDDRPWSILEGCFKVPRLWEWHDWQGTGGADTGMAGKVPNWETTIDSDHLSGLRSIGCPVQPEEKVHPGSNSESIPPDPEAPIDDRSRVSEVRRIAKHLNSADLDKLLRIARILAE